MKYCLEEGDMGLGIRCNLVMYPKIEKKLRLYKKCKHCGCVNDLKDCLDIRRNCRDAMALCGSCGKSLWRKK